MLSAFESKPRMGCPPREGASYSCSSREDRFGVAQGTLPFAGRRKR